VLTASNLRPDTKDLSRKYPSSVILIMGRTFAKKDMCYKDPFGGLSQDPSHLFSAIVLFPPTVDTRMASRAIRKTSQSLMETNSAVLQFPTNDGEMDCLEGLSQGQTISKADALGALPLWNASRDFKEYLEEVGVLQCHQSISKGDELDRRFSINHYP
jgi:hypothetical protein